MMKNYVLQKKQKVLFCKKVGVHGTPGTPGVDGPVYVLYIYIYIYVLYIFYMYYIYIYICIYFTFYMYYRCTQGEDTCFIGRSDREKGWNEMRRGDCNPLCNMLRVRPFTRSASSNALFNDLVSGNKQINRLGEN